MKYSTAFFISTVITMTSSTGHAAGLNLDLFAGEQGSDHLQWNGQRQDTNSGKALGIGISKQVSPRTEVGFEVGYTKNKYRNSKPDYITGTSAMLTTKYDFARYGRLQAYGGLGLGLVSVKYKNHANGYSNRDTVAAGQLMLGARMAVSPRSSLFLEARHIDTFRDPKVALNPASARAEYNGNSLVLGWRYRF